MPPRCPRGHGCSAIGCDTFERNRNLQQVTVGFTPPEPGLPFDGLAQGSGVERDPFHHHVVEVLRLGNAAVRLIRGDRHPWPRPYKGGGIEGDRVLGP